MTEGSAINGSAGDLVTAIRNAARQAQFLHVVSEEEARVRFTEQLDLSPLPSETVTLSAALGRVLAHDVTSPVDVPPFDRANVDGFAVRSTDTLGASHSTPRRLSLNGEIIVCGHAPEMVVLSGSATTIATGGVIPRGADAVVMIEQTELRESPQGPAIDVRGAARPGQFISYAGSDIARGEVVLRRKGLLSSREIGVLAACGINWVEVVRRPRVAVISTGDELVEPGGTLGTAQLFDSNGAIIAAAIAEAGGEPIAFGAFPDDENTLENAMREALGGCDMVVVSGGTSKGAGDLSHRIVSGLGEPGILVHGVALKPGKPLCLAVIKGKPVAVLPGFPTSAIFTFHTFAAPVIRARAGLSALRSRSIEAEIPVRIPSELGRKEFVLVALVEGERGPIAFPALKGSGAVTSFSQADGFVEVDALASGIEPGTRAPVTLLRPATEIADLVLIGSHDLGLDVVLGAVSEQGMSSRTLAIGSLGGVAAVERGECDLAPVHLLDPTTGNYNEHLLRAGLTLVKGWRRMQGLVCRADDPRFAGLNAQQAIEAAISNGTFIMVNRNAGSGTRILIDTLLGSTRPAGYSNQPRSHNAVAAAVAQKRADWGVAIETVAHLYGLEFLPIAPEEYDFLLRESRRQRPAVQAFLAALRDSAVRDKIRALHMSFAD